MSLTFGELFAGVSGMGMGLERAGFSCRWRVEFDKQAAGVLAYRYPGVPLYSNVEDFFPTDEHTVDLVAGGSPCQDLSVAGLREGLAGSRSGLFFQMVRICRALRCRYVQWENVLGALSSNGGRDFACVIGAFTGCVPDVPHNGWGYGGFAKAASPDRWNVAWRVLDSEYFGVPQRRYRVFLVGCIGNGSPVEILFNPESVRGDSPPSREEGEVASGTLSARTQGGGGLGTDFEIAGGLVPAVTGTLCNNGKASGSATQQDAENDMLIPSVATCLQARDGKGADSDTKSGHLIPVAFDTTQITNPDNRSNPQPSAPCHPLAAAAHPPTIAFCHKMAGDTQLGVTNDGSPPLTGQPNVAVCFSGRERGDDGRGYDRAPNVTGDIAGALDTVKPHRVAFDYGVRRLTPTECERLQGWEDGWTKYAFKVQCTDNTWRVTHDKVRIQKDGPRYKQAGNGVTANVAEWLGNRIKTYA